MTPHPFQPDPATPTACVVCALHPAWHPEHQPPEATKEIMVEAIRSGSQPVVVAIVRAAQKRGSKP
jgi:hypothetical protein